MVWDPQLVLLQVAPGTCWGSTPPAAVGVSISIAYNVWFLGEGNGPDCVQSFAESFEDPRPNLEIVIVGQRITLSKLFQTNWSIPVAKILQNPVCLIELS